MDIVIVNPPGSGGRRYLKEGRCEGRVVGQTTVPITMALLAAMVRLRGLSAGLVDCGFPDYSRFALETLLSNARAVFLATSTASWQDDMAFAAWCKARFPQTLLLAWGALATALPGRMLMENPALDALVVGEPEAVMDALLDAWTAAGKDPWPLRRDLPPIPGLLLRDDEGFALPTLPQNPVTDRDRLPIPARGLLRCQDYREPLSGRPYTAIQVSKGCPFNCRFCSVAGYHGTALRRRSVQSVVAEMDQVMREQRIDRFLLLADTFTLNRSWVQEFCDTIPRLGRPVSWFCNSRVDLMDAALARDMGRAGCRLVSFGAERADQDTQQALGKVIDPRAFHAAVNACNQAGIHAYFYWILGFPGETREGVATTIATAFAVNADFAAFYHAVPYPGTPLYREARDLGLLRHEDWRRYDPSFCDALALPQVDFSLVKGAIRFARSTYFARPRWTSRFATRFTPAEVLHLARAARDRACASEG